MKECVFCSRDGINNRIIAENDLAYAFPSNKPIGIAHILVVPKQHKEKYADMSEEERDAVFNLGEEIKLALVKAYKAEGFNCAWNEGVLSGQSVPHFHYHIVPRTKDDRTMYGYEPREFLYRNPIENKKPKEEELSELASEIREHLL